MRFSHKLLNPKGWGATRSPLLESLVKGAVRAGRRAESVPPSPSFAHALPPWQCFGAVKR